MDVTGTTALNTSSNSKAGVLPQDARVMQGAWLFLAALSVFFFSSVLLYMVYVGLRLAPETDRPLSLELPYSFFASTLLLIGVSGALEWAVRAAKRDQAPQVKRLVAVATLCGLLFMVAQSEGMYRLIQSLLQSGSARNSVYALTFVLVFLHALHVVGGMIGLTITLFKAKHGRYDHERHAGLKFCAVYWHFLDIVWVVLVICFLNAQSLVAK